MQAVARPYGFLVCLALGAAGILKGIRCLRKEPDNMPAIFGMVLSVLTILFTIPAWFISSLFF